jgi:predicted site-specific integrase-resolvase
MQSEKKSRAEGLRDLAGSLGVSYDTLWRMSKTGALRTIRIGKRLVVPAAEIERIEREGLQAKAS